MTPGVNAWILDFPADREWDDPADSSFTFYLAHDSRFFYVGVQALDDVVTSDDPNAAFWRDDAIEIVIDALNDRYDNNTDNSQDTYGGHSYVNFEGRFSEWDDDAGDIASFRWSNDVNWTYGDGPTNDIYGTGQQTSDGWAMEVRFDKRLFEDPDAGNKLQDDYAMGFNIGMDDDDQQGPGLDGSGERAEDLEIQYFWANRLRPLGWNADEADAYSPEEIASGEFMDDYDLIIDSTGRLSHGGTGEIVFAKEGGARPALQPGDADQDLDFDQLDLVRVQIAAKYLTGGAATWGDGDWNGGPGGSQGSPPPGNGLFDQLDIIAALNAGKYLAGPYAAIQTDGRQGDVQTSIIYNAITGEVAVDAPAGKELTSVNIESAAAIFTGAPAQNLGGSFDNDADNNIFKATFGSSFGSLSFGNVAQPGLAADVVANDLTVVGSLAGGGDLGAVDLVYIPVPEPATLVLFALGVMVACGRRRV